MYYEEQDLPELHQMKHRHDDSIDYVNYQDKILTNTLSGFIFNNDLMNSFILKLQRLVSILFDNQNIIKNFKNPVVDKYYYKHHN